MTRQQNYNKLLRELEDANGTDRTLEARERFRRANVAFEEFVWLNRHRITVASDAVK